MRVIDAVFAGDESRDGAGVNCCSDEVELRLGSFLGEEGEGGDDDFDIVLL